MEIGEGGLGFRGYTTTVHVRLGLGFTVLCVGFEVRDSEFAVCILRFRVWALDWVLTVPD